MEHGKRLELSAGGESLLEFTAPDSASLEDLRCLFEGMPSAPSALWDNLLALGSTVVRGSRARIIQQLAAALREDCAGNACDSELNADYCVAQDVAEPHRLFVNTRLFYPGHGRNVCYGFRIERIGGDDYLLWADHYSSLLS